MMMIIINIKIAKEFSCVPDLPVSSVPIRCCTDYTAQCVLCKVYFSAQPNKLRPILKIKKYYPIEHICPSLFECAGNILF